MLRPWSLLLLLALAALAAPVAAQPVPMESTLALGEPEVAGLPMAVDGVPANVTVPWTYTAAATTSTSPRSSATLTWAVSCAAAGIAVMGPATEAIALQTGTTSYSGSSSFTATASMEAPAEEQIPCTFTAYVEDASPVGERTENATAVANLVVAFRGVLSLDIESNLVGAAPGEAAVYLLRVTNFSNGPAQVNVAAGQVPDGWEAIVPEAIVLDRQASTDIELRLEGQPTGIWTDTTATAAFDVWPSSTVDAAQRGGATQVTVQANLQGFSLMTLQTVWVLLLLAAIAGGLVYWRHRKGSAEGKGDAKPVRQTRVLSRGRKGKGEKAADLDEAVRGGKDPKKGRAAKA